MIRHRREARRCAVEDASSMRRGATTGADNEYVLASLLGKGGFSEVWKAFDTKKLGHVALKVHQLNQVAPTFLQRHLSE
jgi:tousled-like kinase